jgi:hypothetical protein
MAKFEPKEERPDADDYRAYFDSNCLRVWHLAGKPLTVRIVDVCALTGEIFAGGKSKVMRQPKLTLKSRDGILPLPLLLNKTNAKTIARLCGSKNPKAWVGHLITLYPTTTDVGGEPQECIRVRPEKPADKRRARPEPSDADDSPAAQPSALLPGDETEPPFGALDTDHGETVQ